MSYELNFEAESFEGSGELEGYEGSELEGYEAEFDAFEADYESDFEFAGFEGESESPDFEYEESKQDALDVNDPNVARALQGALRRATGVRLPAVGRLGPQAAGLLRAIQKRHRIKPSGVVGVNTLNALKRDIASNFTQGEAGFELENGGDACAKECKEVFDRCLKYPSTSVMHGYNCILAQQNCLQNCERRRNPPPPRPAPPPKPAPPPPAPPKLPTLRPGSTDPAVKVLQNRLNVWLAKNKGVKLPKLPVTGKYGTMTEVTVRAVQRANGLRVDGVVGKDTWGKLPSP